MRILVRSATILGLAVAFRWWHTGWGASRVEREEPLPGDEFPVSRFGMRATRAITIDASPSDVWPWLVQIGTGKAGWYSYDVLDNLGRPSAVEVLDRWQGIAPGDPAAPMNPFAAVEASPWRVAQVVRHETLLWRNPGAGTWVWVLRPTKDGRTRLVTRIRIAYNSVSGLAFAPILELADFPMYRRMLLGIKQRAEALAGRHDSSHPTPTRAR